MVQAGGTTATVANHSAAGGRMTVSPEMCPSVSCLGAKPSFKAEIIASQAAALAWFCHAINCTYKNQNQDSDFTAAIQPTAKAEAL
jgi:hypothetical protein